MIADLNAGHYRCQVFRYSPCRCCCFNEFPSPSLASTPFRGAFFLAGDACNFISSPIHPRPTHPSPPASSDSYRKFVPYDSPFPRLLSTVRPPPSQSTLGAPYPALSILHSLPPFSHRDVVVAANDGLSRGSGYGNGVEATVLTSFGLVLLLFCLPPGNRQCIFYNAAMSRREPGLVLLIRLASSGTPRLTLPATTISDGAISIARMRVRDFAMLPTEL